MGDVSDTRKKIIQNTLTQELSKHFQIIPQDRFEQVQEQVFNELEFEECTEKQCIIRIQEILQTENLFHLEVIGEGADTQLNLKWSNLDETRNVADYCENCKNLLLKINKYTNKSDTHFINIDKRKKDSDGNIILSLEGGQEVIMPKNITKVPALLLLNDNYFFEAFKNITFISKRNRLA